MDLNGICNISEEACCHKNKGEDTDQTEKGLLASSDKASEQDFNLRTDGTSNFLSVPQCESAAVVCNEDGLKSTNDMRKTSAPELKTGKDIGKVMNETQKPRGGVPFLSASIDWLRKHLSDESKRKYTLEDFGYHFLDGRLCETKDTSKGFMFKNQEEYVQIGEFVTEHVYKELKETCGLKRHPVPMEEDWSKATFVFTSNDYESKELLLVLIHGSGVVRAGQWSRRLIINENMEKGSQIPYIEKAKDLGYAVLVLNTNDNSRNGEPIKGSDSPCKHAEYIWEHHMMRANHIAIVAHSYGGVVTTHLLQKFPQEFMKKVIAVAFADACVGKYPDELRDYFHKIGRNWVSSYSPSVQSIDAHGFPCVPAGTAVHEETPHIVMNDVFKFIQEHLKDKE